MVLPWCWLKGPAAFLLLSDWFHLCGLCSVSVLPRFAQKRCFLKFPFLVQHEDLLKNKMECGSDEKLKPNNPLENGCSQWSALSEQDFSLYSPPWEMVGCSLGYVNHWWRTWDSWVVQAGRHTVLKKLGCEQWFPHPECGCESLVVLIKCRFWFRGSGAEPVICISNHLFRSYDAVGQTTLGGVRL